MSVIFINPYRFGVAYDADAQAYMTAVETADGQALETGVRDAINAFVVGCKADGIWPAIKASCILAGARTLAGALVPLVGTAPTNFNFVSGDYNRKTGVQGGAAGKYLNTNVDNANAGFGTQNNKHIALYVPVTSPDFTRTYIAGGNTAINVATSLAAYLGTSNNSAGTNTAETHAASSTDFPFMGTSRTLSNSYTLRARGSNTTVNRGTAAPSSGEYVLFWNGATSYTNCKIAFYSIGESLDLALLDTRITDLINAFAAAIP
jgi:hypothetical protein